MSGSFNAILTLSRDHRGADLADLVHESELGAFHAVTGVDDRGRAQVIITLCAESLPQAVATARALFCSLDGQVRLEVMTTEEYDAADAQIPELSTVSEAAAKLGVTRQAVQRRIDRGTLPGRQIGTRWVVPTSAIDRE